MTTSSDDHNSDNVVDIFTGKSFSERLSHRIIRIAPELDGLEMLYSNASHPDKLFSIKVLCWGLRADGSAVGVVPWLDGIVACQDIRDPLKGRWEGYFDPGVDEIFYEAPIHKVLELETSADYYRYSCEDDKDIIQEVPDTIGTHAVLSEDGFKSIVLKEVVSWRLHHDGTLSGMLIDDDKVEETPVLPGDPCLFPADESEHFRYFFQHHIANKIKARDPEALAAISMLVDS
ncbi:MAG: hypothetical protein ACWA5K_03075 [bacterium]